MVRDGLKTDEFWAGSLLADALSGTSLAIQAATTNAATSTATTFSGTTFNVAENLIYAAGSPYGKGTAIKLAARSNISGGTWVTASGGLALAGPAAVMAPLGVSLPGENVASGGTVTVIIQGIVPMIAEGTVALGGGVEVGAGAALNTVKPHAAGSGMVFPTLGIAGSEGVVFVVLK